MVDVVVELLERRHQLGVFTDLRANWDELVRIRLDAPTGAGARRPVPGIARFCLRS